MPQFTDATSRDWTVRVDVTAVKNVREVGVDLGDLGKAADNLIRLADDPVLLCNVLYVLCEDQAKDRDVTEEQFGRLLAGDVIGDATVALEESIINFFPQSKRSLMQRLRKKVDRVQKMGEDLVAEKLEDSTLEDRILATMKAKMEATIQGSMTTLSSASSTPESSA